MKKMTCRCLRLRLRISISCGEESFSCNFFFPSFIPVNPSGETFLIEKVYVSFSVQHCIMFFTGFSHIFSNQLFNEKRLDTHHLLFSITNESKQSFTHDAFPLWKTPFMFESKLKKITELVLMRSRWTRWKKKKAICPLLSYFVLFFSKWISFFEWISSEKNFLLELIVHS